MARVPDIPETSLTLNRRSATLAGTAGGKTIHVQVRGGLGIPVGRYRVGAPALHPALGRAATVEAYASTANTANQPAPGNVLATANTALLPSPRNVLVTANTALVPSPRNVLAGHSVALIVSTNQDRGGSGTNTIVVLSQYEELMDALEASGGGILQVVA